jgi:hypothetical protein
MPKKGGSKEKRNKGGAHTCTECNQEFTSKRKLHVHLGSSLNVEQACPQKGTKPPPTVSHKPGSKRPRETVNLDEDWQAPHGKRAKHSPDNDSRASSFGGIITFGGGAVYWKSTISKNKPGSTHESELQAAYHTAKAALHIRRILDEMGYPQSEPSALHVDNAGVIQTCLRIAVPSKSRHIERQFFNLRDWADRVKTTDIDTKVNPADVMTKPLSKDQHWYLCGMFMRKAPDVHKC